MAYHGWDDPHLLRDALSGMPLAFEWIRERARGFVISTHTRVFKRVPGGHESRYSADDLEQESLIALWNRIASGKPIIRLRSYLFRIIERIAERQKPKWETKNADEEHSDDRESYKVLNRQSRPCDDESPDLQLSRSELKFELRKSLRTLTTAQQRVIVRVIGLGHSRAGIALATGVGVNTVNTRLFRGLEHLRSSLAVRGFDASDLMQIAA